MLIKMYLRAENNACYSIKNARHSAEYKASNNTGNNASLIALRIMHPIVLRIMHH